MTSCTIIISHYESLPFLHAAIRQIRKHAHSEIYQRIIIIDQSKNQDTIDIVNKYVGDEDAIVFHTHPYYSGYGIDALLRTHNIGTDYVCQLHADAFPIHKNWIHLPITLIEENDFSFVGQLQFISKANDTIYPPEPFFAMAQCFNVAKTSTYRELSFEAGFTRFHAREKAPFGFSNNEWADWASADYWARGSDDDVVAFHWQDKYREVNKLGLAITGFIEPSFGRIIEDVVFHFGSANESRGVMDKMPPMYQIFTEEINKDYSDKLIDYMVGLAKRNTPPNMEILSRNVWNGKLKKSFPSSPELDKRIEELKK